MSAITLLVWLFTAAENTAGDAAAAAHVAFYPPSKFFLPTFHSLSTELSASLRGVMRMEHECQTLQLIQM